MDGFIMGCETVDTTGDDLLVVPGESVFNKMKESLISVIVLVETGFDVVFRHGIPVDADLDEVDPLLHRVQIMLVTSLLHMVDR